MDLDDDVTAGFDLISTWDLDEHGLEWIAKKIKARVGTGPVVISLDVDVMDPSYVPASKSRTTHSFIGGSTHVDPIWDSED